MTQYWISDGNRDRGPFTIVQIKEFADRGELRPDYKISRRADDAGVLRVGAEVSKDSDRVRRTQSDRGSGARHRIRCGQTVSCMWCEIETSACRTWHCDNRLRGRSRRDNPAMPGLQLLHVQFMREEGRGRKLIVSRHDQSRVSALWWTSRLVAGKLTGSCQPPIEIKRVAVPSIRDSELPTVPSTSVNVQPK